MKKTTLFITTSLFAVTTAMKVLCMEFEDDAAAAKYLEGLIQEAKIIEDNFEKGKTDDDALKKAIRLHLFVILDALDKNPALDEIDHMHRLGFPRERQIKILEEMVRENLFSIKKKVEADDLFLNEFLLDMLKTFKEYDIMPILNECLNSQNEEIRLDAQKRYNIITGKSQNQPKPNDNEDIPPTPSIISNFPNLEPPQPTITTETALPIPETPPEQPEKTSIKLYPLWFVFITLLAVISGFLLKKKK